MTEPLSYMLWPWIEYCMHNCAMDVFLMYTVALQMFIFIIIITYTS